MITLKLDQSNPWRGLHFVDNHNKPVPVEEALERGFVVEPEDTPAVCSLLQQFVLARDENHG
jgi:hypothetical protein